MDNKSINDMFKGVSKKVFVSDKIKKALDDTIELEFDAYNSYKSMHTWAKYNSYFGLAALMEKQYKQELEHRDKVINYAVDRNVLPNPSKTRQILVSYADCSDVLSKALNKEIEVENGYKALYELANKEKDFTTVEFTHWLLSEQVEEIALFIDLIDRVKLLGPALFDMELLEKYGE